MGDPRPSWGYALASLGQSLARAKNVRGQHPLRAEMWSPEKSTLWSIYIRLNNFFVYGPKYTNFFSPNVGGVVVDKLRFRFSICGSVPGIFAIKVESCQKSRKNFGRFFGPPKFFGAGLLKIVPSLSLLLRGTSTEKFREDTPTSPEVMEPNCLTRWILGPVLNFHD